MRRLAFAFALMSSIAGPALAADPFVGPHVEAVAGLDSTDAGPGLGARDAFLYGVAGGYDWRFGAAVAGVEAEADGSTGRQTIAGIDYRVGRSLYAGVRAGVIVSRDLLVYAKGGYANGRFTTSAGGGSTDGGYRVGAGAEYAVSRQVFLRGEYRYTNYGSLAGQHFVGALGYRF